LVEMPHVLAEVERNLSTAMEVQSS